MLKVEINSVITSDYKSKHVKPCFLITDDNDATTIKLLKDVTYYLERHSEGKLKSTSLKS